MSHLCNANQDTFWPRLKWPDFAAMLKQERVVVILPVAGFADWGNNLPLDWEEQVAMEILKRASQQLHPAVPHLVLPPQRYVTGSRETAAFTMKPDEVYDAISEIIESVKASGFRKVVFYNSSPWNEDLLETIARDLRVDFGMQTFCINLSGLGIDLSEPQTEVQSEDAAAKLASLLGEVASKPGLANDGVIPRKGDAE